MCYCQFSLVTTALPFIPICLSPPPRKKTAFYILQDSLNFWKQQGKKAASGNCNSNFVTGYYHSNLFRRLPTACSNEFKSKKKLWQFCHLNQDVSDLELFKIKKKKSLSFTLSDSWEKLWVRTLLKNSSRQTDDDFRAHLSPYVQAAARTSLFPTEAPGMIPRSSRMTTPNTILTGFTPKLHIPGKQVQVQSKLVQGGQPK